MLTSIFLAIGAAVMGVLGWVVAATKKDQGRLEKEAEIARLDNQMLREMAKVQKPTDDEVLKRLDDGTA